METATMRCANCDQAIIYFPQNLQWESVHKYSKRLACLTDDGEAMTDENGVILTASRGEE